MIAFLVSQGAAQAHIAEWGHDHDHDGRACHVTILAEDVDQPPSPTEHVCAFYFQTEPLRFVPIVSAVFNSAYVTRAPPPRAPPQ